MKRIKQHQLLAKSITLSLLTGLVISATAFALPQGGEVLTTNATMTAAATAVANKKLDITGVDSPTNVAIKWQNFDIGKGETVTFSNMTNVLNYVAGGSTRSEIYGTLSAPSTNVYLVNPKGILIGDGAQVTAKSFTASTTSLTDADLKNFNGTLTSNISATSKDVLNLGTITADKVTLEGNNVVLRNTASLTDGTNKLQGSAVTLNAVTSVSAGYELTKATGKDFNISGTTITKSVHDYAHADTANAASNLNYTYSGTVKAPVDHMLVDNVYDLQNIDANLSGKYMLNGNIDASTTSTWNNSLGFSPIGGSDGAKQFTGTLDGLNFIIDGLTSLRPAEKTVGLFGYIGSNGKVQNLEFANINLSGLSYVGSVAGEVGGGTQATQAYVTNIETAGKLRLYATANGVIYCMIGGVVGYIPSGTYANVNKGYNKAEITVDGTAVKHVFAAGIIGEIYSKYAVLENSVNAGNIYVYGGSNDGDSHAGGIASSSYGTVKNCYNSGNIWVYKTTGISAAGIVGKTQVKDSGNPTIMNCYNSGSVLKGLTPTTATVQGSGIVDKYVGDKPTLTNNFYDSSKTQYAYSHTMDSVAGATADATGSKTTAELKQLSTYPSTWDFNNVWVIYNGNTMPLIKDFLKKAAFNSTSVYTNKEVTLTTDQLGAVMYAPSTTVTIYASDGTGAVNKVNGSQGLTYINSGSKDVSANFYSTQDGYFLDPYYVDKATLVLTIGTTPHTIVYGTAENTISNSYTYEYINGLQEGDSLADALVDANGKTVEPTFLNLAFTNSTAIPKGGTATGTITKDVGQYNIILDCSTLKDYKIVTENSITTVTPAPLTVTANNVSMTYGTTEAALVKTTPYSSSTTGLTNGDSLTDVLNTIAYTNEGYTDSTGSGTYDGIHTKNAGAPNLKQNIASYTNGTKAGNYTITTVPGAVTITKAIATVTPNSITKQYGDAQGVNQALAAEQPVVTGLVNGDADTGVTGTPVYSTAALRDSTHTNNVGSYDLNIDVSGLSSTNYDFVGAKLTDGATITPAALTLTANDVNMTYGTQEAALVAATPYGYTHTALANGDKLEDVLGDVTYTNGGYTNSTGGGTYDGTHTKNAGTAGLQQKIANYTTGTAGGNYTFTVKDGTVNIAKAQLTIRPDPLTINVGDPVGNLTGSVTGLTNDDTDSPTYTTDITDTNVPGTYHIYGSYTNPQILNNYVIIDIPAPLIVNGMSVPDHKTYHDITGNITTNNGYGGRKNNDYTVNIKNLSTQGLNVGSQMDAPANAIATPAPVVSTFGTLAQEKDQDSQNNKKKDAVAKKMIDNTTGVNALTIVK